MRPLAWIIAFALPLLAAAQMPPDHTEPLLGIDEDAMRSRLDRLDLQPVEGIWYYPAERVTLAIERNGDLNDGSYRLILLDSDDIDHVPGMVMGFLQAGATPDKWQLHLYSQRDRTTLLKPLSTVATLSKEATTLTFDPPHWQVKVRINFARFLPSLFRGVSIIPEKVEESMPIGFTKRYPEGGDSNHFNKVRYL